LSCRQQSPFFGPCEGAIDEGFADVNLAPLVEILRKGVKESFQRAVPAPLLEVAVTRLVWG
jgi:hypothetical protein